MAANLEEFRKMSDEERSVDLLDSMSDTIKEAAHQLMMLKAIARNDLGVRPEDFDKAMNREFEKEWNKLKNKTAPEIALMGMIELVMHGKDLGEVLGEEKE